MRKLLLYLGGSSFVKGFHVLLKALDEIARRHDDLRVFMTRVKGAKGLARNYMVCEKLPYEELVKLHARGLRTAIPIAVGGAATLRRRRVHVDGHDARGL
jgi:hypothetical protein